MYTFLGIFVAILMLNLIVAIHEGGHLFFMRRFGVKVEQFSIGFKPHLYRRKLKDGMTFTVGALLLGGFVRPAEEGKKVDDCTWWQRALIFAGGMLFNVVTAALALTAYSFIDGKSLPDFGLNLSSWPYAIAVPVEAFSEMLHIWAVSPWLIAQLLGDIAVAGGKEIAAVVIPTIQSSPSDLSEKVAGVAGPVGIVQIISGTVAPGMSVIDSLVKVLMMFVVISVSIAGFNLVPLMPLDGGHLAEIAIRRIGGIWAINIFRFVGQIVFLAIILLAFGADIYRLIV